MNLDTIRVKIYALLNIPYTYCYYGMRGQNDVFHGKIVKIYSRVFIIETDNNIIKCFSYSDFATKLLKVI